VTIFAARALLPDGWARDVTIDIDRTRTIAGVRANSDARDATRAPGTLVPAMANVHSHAFQFAMAGHAERATPNGDDFWTWRHAMYELAGRLDPDTLYDVARAAYAEMARGGYTSVAEFHYLHRDPHGAWYAQRSIMAETLVRAARDAGLAICLLPALYSQAAPDGTPLAREQRRFATGVDDILEIARDVRVAFAGDPDVCVGVCAHSLRAVRPDELRALVEASPPDVPVHLHIAEQEREVVEIERVLGARPIAWLVDHFDVDARWCLVHATRATPAELVAIARSGAVVGLCPTTEANLGDGTFGYETFVAAGGAYGIGSDSNVTCDAAAELRLLEYGQRLMHRRRVIAGSPGGSCGEALYTRAAAGGGGVSGFAIGEIAIGRRARFVAIADADERNEAATLDRHIFATHAPPVHVPALSSSSGTV
jgi:formimidoylglutamate deiminase